MLRRNNGLRNNGLQKGVDLVQKNMLLITKVIIFSEPIFAYSVRTEDVIIPRLQKYYCIVGETVRSGALSAPL